MASGKDFFVDLLRVGSGDFSRAHEGMDRFHRYANAYTQGDCYEADIGSAQSAPESHDYSPKFEIED